MCPVNQYLTPTLTSPTTTQSESNEIAKEHPYPCHAEDCSEVNLSSRVEIASTHQRNLFSERNEPDAHQEQSENSQVR